MDIKHQMKESEKHYNTDWMSNSRLCDSLRNIPPPNLA